MPAGEANKPKTFEFKTRDPNSGKLVSSPKDFVTPSEIPAEEPTEEKPEAAEEAQPAHE